tara:strand:+ start:8975 stop:9487 length:513 start_codon:yes stop_codon:yes gene_type:complete
MSNKFSLSTRLQSLVCALVLFFVLIFPSSSAMAKRPPEIRNQEDLKITEDMHGQDLNGYEFVKFDLRGINFSESDLRGAVFNNSKMKGANFNGANLKDALAYASDFEDADLREVNFSNALLMESSFKNARIEGADFTDAVISRIQQKELCSIAEGSNTLTGVETSYSLGC